MKDWLTIGQFSKKSGLSARSLRLYDKKGLLHFHSRGENQYRYYHSSQVEKATTLKRFKLMGFTLSEIKLLLDGDQKINFSQIEDLYSDRLKKISKTEKELAFQKKEIECILTSLKSKQKPLNKAQRRNIMNSIEKLLIIVTGTKRLEDVAKRIQKFLGQNGHDLSIWKWDNYHNATRPGILVINENEIHGELPALLKPNIIVINDMSNCEESTLEYYNKLYKHIDDENDETLTVLHAEDKTSVEFARLNDRVRKGRIYYFSKNTGLEEEISTIGGVVSDGSEIKIYGLNRQKGNVTLKLSQPHSYDEEICLLASLTAITDIGLNEKNLVHHFSL